MEHSSYCTDHGPGHSRQPRQEERPLVASQISGVQMTDQAPAANVTDTIFRITFYCEKTPPPSLTRRRRHNTVPGTVTKQRKLVTRISRTRHRRNVTGAMLFYSAFSSVQVHTFTQRRPSLAYPAHQCYMLHSIVLFTYH